jgi:glycerol-3-phosphate acyltransferase PlsY
LSLALKHDLAGFLDMMSDPLMQIVVVVFLAYFLGSIPFGLIITKLGGAGDIRKVGSGNIGATNVLRTGNRKLAALTLLFDAGKGAVAVLAAAGTDIADAPALAAVCVVLGHCFPVWLKFHGGKGVATGLAVLASLDVRLGLLFAAVWLGTAYLTRYSSLSALLSVGACAMAGFILLPGFGAKTAVLVLCGVIWVRHHANIGRLLSGTETKIGKGG